MNWFRITAEILEHIASKFREAADEVTVLAEPVKEIESTEFGLLIDFTRFSVRTTNWLKLHGFKTVKDLLERSDDELIQLGMGSGGLKEVNNYKEYIED